ncbi:putative glycosyl hydrolases family 18 protein 4 [Elsinoe fawcettii]|nr:putative glycosyl hydrolases family 18 protein 4 [Elsinoe fawcettii]
MYNKERRAWLWLLLLPYHTTNHGVHAQSSSTDGAGRCPTHVVQTGETCLSIAVSYETTSDQIERVNNQTWGWRGCAGLEAKSTICIGEGLPPLPPVLDDALCGPQMPGTKADDINHNVSSLNPCPLNACCSAFGYCGTTPDFCASTDQASSTTRGCISNCGTDVRSSSDPPKQFISIAYFQAYNKNRACLTMNVSQIEREKYSHIHYSFAKLKPDSFEVDITDIEDDFYAFVEMRDFKRILTFGGWAFSTSPDSYSIFRSMVKPENIDRATSTIANFVVQHDLDGVDIDWEYPSATDIPGIPAGQPSEGLEFSNFLGLLRNKLPKRSVSIALPSGYWYLKVLPVIEIVQHVDYAVYMTYDYHGLWDFGNRWSQSGCVNGDCLRSHVNMTETMESLALITKAGVPSNKIVVGITSYGRGFHMESSNCTDPGCLWTQEAPQPKGRCTQEEGVLADGEINELRKQQNSIYIRDERSDSDIVVFPDSAWWIAHMNEKTKLGRIGKYRMMNFAGTSDWAVDLQGITSET